MRVRAALCSIAVATCWLLPEDASACSGDACRTPLVFPPDGRIPANQLILKFSPARDLRNDSVGSVKLYRLQGGSRTELALRDQPQDPATASRALIPTEAVAPGTRLLLEASAPACKPDATLSTEFEVTDEAEVPDTLGSLKIDVRHAPLDVATTRGSCTETVDAAYADLEVLLGQAAQPFEDVADYSLVLDGKPFASFSAHLALPTNLGRAKDRVYAACESAPLLIGGTSLGTHRVQVRGTLPDGKLVSTPEYSFELSCGARAADAGVDAAGGKQSEPPPRQDRADAAAPSDEAAAAGGKQSESPSRQERAGAAALSGGAGAAGASGMRNFVTPASDGCGVVRPSRSRISWTLTALFGLAVLRRARRRR